MPTIRPYRPDDLSAVYEICVRTGNAGGDARGMFDSDALLGDVFAAPYVTLEPQSAFVLEDETGTVGYVLGTADTAALVDRWAAQWVPYLNQRYPEPRTEVDLGLLRMGLNPERMLVPGLEAYPAHLHIDLLPQAQGRGFGRQLIATFLAAVAEAGAPAVHLGMAPANDRARGFYQRLGFTVLEAGDPATVTYFGRATSGPV